MKITKISRLASEYAPSLDGFPPSIRLLQTVGFANQSAFRFRPAKRKGAIELSAHSTESIGRSEAVSSADHHTGQSETTPAASVADHDSSNDDSPPDSVDGMAAIGEDCENTPDEDEPRRPGVIRKIVAGISWLVSSLFNLLSLIVCLTVLAAAPVLQLITFGYLLDVAGRMANGQKLRHALPHSDAAGKIGLVVAAVFVAGLPVQLLTHWESVATLISPGSASASWLRAGAILMATLGIFHVLWSISRGGKLVHFLWPQPLRMAREAWRPRTYRGMPDQLWKFTASLDLWRYFWLGARGAFGTLIWLVPAMVIIAANRNGETGLAGLVGAAAVLGLGVVLLYLPMLQTHFAAENRLQALFDVRRVRRLFCYAPWSWLVAMICGLVLLPIPLYLLKIEATPREVVWLPTLVFVSFILPARVAEGLAMRRAKRIARTWYDNGKRKPAGWLHLISRMTVRLLMPAVVAIYLAFVTISQYTSWDGLQTWVQQHAVLIPIPFLGV